MLIGESLSHGWLRVNASQSFWGYKTLTETWHFGDIRFFGCHILKAKSVHCTAMLPTV